MGEWTYCSTILDLTKWSASCTNCFIPGESAPGTHWIEGWVGPRAGLGTRHPARSPLLYQLSCCGSKYVLEEREFVAVCYQLTLVRYASADSWPTLAREEEVLAAQKPERLPLAMSMWHQHTEKMHCTIHYHKCNNVNSKKTQEKLRLTYNKLHNKSVTSSLSANNEVHILKYRLLHRCILLSFIS
jgi:hypothetical protein